MTKRSWLDRPIVKFKGYRQRPGKPLPHPPSVGAAIPKPPPQPQPPQPPRPPPPSPLEPVAFKQPKATAAHIIKWIQERCRVASGPLIGKPFMLDDWQKVEIERIYDNPLGTRRAILSVARKCGKGLALDTPVPTPRGWSTMGALEIGDEVFDEHGEVCRVTFKSPVHIGLRCWRLRFFDGTSIVADQDHQWVTTHRYRPWAQPAAYASGKLRGGSGYGARPRTAVVTTPQIAQSVHIPRPDGVVEHNHKIAVAEALICPEAALSVPPYVLGYWLGNGSTKDATIHVGAQDEAAIITELERELEFEVSARKVAAGKHPTYGLTTGRSTDYFGVIQGKLRALGVIGDKHIPDIYKWASREQRLALLQGLMDSDGTASTASDRSSPRCYFDVTNEALARDALFVVRSLGFKATIREDVAKINGRAIGPVWSIAFTAYREDEVFRLQRRAAPLQPRPPKKMRSRSNAIEACDEVPSVPTVCIQVDSPSQLFLAGEGLTPTHNTGLASVLLLVHLIGPKARPNSQLFSTAQSREQAALIFAMAAKIVRMSPELRDSVVIRESMKQLYCPDLGTMYRALSAEAKTSYGLDPVFVIHDELGQVRGPRSALYDALETATGAQEDPLSIIISTQAPTDADLLSVLIDDALAGHDPRVICKLYTAAPTLPPFEAATIKLANPAFGTFLNSKEVLAMAEDARRMPSREAEYRNLILNQRVEACQQFIQPAQWAACGTPVGDLTQVKEVYGGLDLSEANDLTALVLIGKINGVWHARSWFWMPGANIFERSRTDHVPYDRWVQDGWLEVVEGEAITYDRIAERICGILAEHKIQKVAFDRWNFAQFKPWLSFYGWTPSRIESKWVEFGQGTQSMSPALRELESRILRRELAHGNNPILNMNAANAVIEGNKDGTLKKDSSARKLSKKRSTGRIDGMIALTMAMGIAPMGAPIDVAALIG